MLPAGCHSCHDSREAADLGVRVTVAGQRQQVQRVTAGDTGTRNRRLQLAWAGNVATKLVAISIQALALPAVFQILGPEGYAVYAAAVSAAGVFGVFNLGMSGAVVTPLAEAITHNNLTAQKKIFATAWWFSCGLSVVGGVVVTAIVLLSPTALLFGQAARGAATSDIRVTTLLAAAAILLGFPLGLADGTRLAYQELHRGTVFALVGSGLLALAVATVAHTRAGVPWVAAAMLLPSIAARSLNVADLWRVRTFLIPSFASIDVRLGLQLLGDGVTYLAATFTHFLLYQWPVYVAARLLPPDQSASFAIVFQVMVLVLSFAGILIHPLWGSVADSYFRADRHWLRHALTLGRKGVAVYGSLALIGFTILGEPILDFWFGSRFRAKIVPLYLVGLYTGAAVWEHLHYHFLAGCGELRRASLAMFVRSVALAAIAPFLLRTFGGRGLMLGLLVSVLGFTAWYYPKILHRRVKNLDTSVGPSIRKEPLRNGWAT